MVRGSVSFLCYRRLTFRPTGEWFCAECDVEPAPAPAADAEEEEEEPVQAGKKRKAGGAGMSPYSAPRLVCA